MRNDSVTLGDFPAGPGSVIYSADRNYNHSDPAAVLSIYAIIFTAKTSEAVRWYSGYIDAYEQRFYIYDPNRNRTILFCIGAVSGSGTVHLQSHMCTENQSICLIYFVF